MSAVERVLLVGMMGSGKTTIGKALAVRLGWPYLDNDELLARSVGKDTRQVQEGDGELALRRAESAALTMALTVPGPLVAGIAAGVVTNPLDCDRLRAGGLVVWLRGSIETLAKRVEGTDRPWLDDDPRRALCELYAGRAHLYESVATLVLDVDELPPERLADRILTSAAAGGAARGG